MNLILAADENWAIGLKGDLLCHLSGDLKYFREMTLGKTLVMGRVTLESLPGKRGLPGRRNIVISLRDKFEAQNAEVVKSFKELDHVLEGINTDDVFVIGGASIYKQLLDRCDKCYVTKIYRKFEADRFFVNLDECEDFEARPLSDIIEENGIRYRFFVYTRKAG